MRKVLKALALSGLLDSCGNAQTKSKSEFNSKESKKMNNKEIVGTFLVLLPDKTPLLCDKLQTQITFNTIHLYQQV
jgi:LEA14-like dessication related protein